MTKSTSVTTALLWGLLSLVFPNTSNCYAQELKGVTQEQEVIAQQLYAAHNQKVYPLEQKLAQLRTELNNQDATSGANFSTVRNIYKEMAEAKTQLFSITDEFNSALVKNGINPAIFAHNDESVRTCW